ncbi:MAG: 2-hydroxyacyl-CoA dehydratase [Dehalococcoidia bacterium]|nr:2-hydroxyacyl-CoA dehydratase [Dehalococcoidia bacterium]
MTEYEMTEYEEVFSNRHNYANEWKAKSGGRVVGGFCSYVPEELLYASGALPVRVFGSHEPQDVTERHIYSMYCPFSRDCLAQGLLGRYDYLDGIVMAHSCLHLRQTFRSWQEHVPMDYVYYLNMPVRVYEPRAKTFLAGQLAHFKNSLEKWTGHPIIEQSLDNAIAVYNTNRRLMKQIYETRRSENPPISGVQAMQMVLSSMVMDKADHNLMLERTIEELRRNGNGSANKATDKVRLMVLGSENDDTGLLKLAESLGAIFVIDDHCTGSRYFWNEVIPEQDRIHAIASRYVDRPPCPEKDIEKRHRFEHILKLAKEYKVQGAIIIQQKFCDPHEFDIPPLQRVLEAEGIPTLRLEIDITTPAGQFRTRVEAFLDMVGVQSLF